jgi:uncharacterized cupin superfamily protein
MEPHPGVFVSNVGTEEWEPDPEVPGSEMHELVHADGVWAGLTRFTTVDGPSPWTPSQRETIHVLQGEVTIEIAGGPTLMLKPGDLASLPAGVETIWHITPPFTELWVLALPVARRLPHCSGEITGPSTASSVIITTESPIRIPARVSASRSRAGAPVITGQGHAPTVPYAQPFVPSRPGTTSVSPCTGAPST